MSVCELIGLPAQVAQAAGIDWGVTVDAYLMDTARVGDRLTALVYCDLSGVSSDGMTIVTPQVSAVEQRAGFTLMRSVGGKDHYVIVSELPECDLAEA